MGEGNDFGMTVCYSELAKTGALSICSFLWAYNPHTISRQRRLRNLKKSLQLTFSTGLLLTCSALKCLILMSSRTSRICSFLITRFSVDVAYTGWWRTAKNTYNHLLSATASSECLHTRMELDLVISHNHVCKDFKDYMKSAKELSEAFQLLQNGVPRRCCRHCRRGGDKEDL